MSAGVKCRCAAAYFGLLALAGCAEGPAASSPSPTGAFDVNEYFLSHGIDLATARDELGMSDDTYAVYEEVADRGYVLVSDIHWVMPEFTECVESVGFEVEFDPTAEGFFGLPNVQPAILNPPGHPPSDGEMELIEACNERTVGTLIIMFFNQPNSPERDQAWIEEGRQAAARTCLNDAGYFVQDDASFQDYVDLGKRMAMETGDSTCLDLVLYG